MNMKKYDLVVIGSGPAGHTAAIKAAQLGMRTAVVEQDNNMIGGVCLNEGCIPAKSLLHSAKLLDVLKNDNSLFGIASDNITPDVGKFVAKSRTAASDLGKGLQFTLKKNKIDLINAKARLKDKNTVILIRPDAIEEDIQADNIDSNGIYPKRNIGTSV